MRKLWRTAVVASVAALLLGSVAMSGPGAYGDDHVHHDVNRSGSCSMNGRWHLELDNATNRIEVHFEAESHAAGQVWKVTMRHNGVLFVDGTRRSDHDGHFEVHKWVHDRAGLDRIFGKGVNRTTGEVCKGLASIRDA